MYKQNLSFEKNVANILLLLQNMLDLFNKK